MLSANIGKKIKKLNPTTDATTNRKTHTIRIELAVPPI
jgi:hypothetical protein